MKRRNFCGCGSNPQIKLRKVICRNNIFLQKKNFLKVITWVCFGKFEKKHLIVIV